MGFRIFLGSSNVEISDNNESFGIFVKDNNLYFYYLVGILVCAAGACLFAGNYDSEDIYLRVIGVILALGGLALGRYSAMKLHHTFSDGIGMIEVISGLIIIPMTPFGSCLNAVGLVLLVLGFATAARERKGFH